MRGVPTTWCGVTGRTSGSRPPPSSATSASTPSGTGTPAWRNGSSGWRSSWTRTRSPLPTSSSRTSSTTAPISMRRRRRSSPTCVRPGPARAHADLDTGDAVQVMSNYAVLLYKHDYDDEAGCLWYRAYAETAGRGHAGLRRAYARYLLDAGRNDLAESVIRGRTIGEPVIQTTRSRLPARR